MGASQSVVSGHHAHPEGRHHRLKRVSGNEVREPCMICAKPVELGEQAYRCRHAGCGFVLHDACYHLPKKMKHFAHSGHHHHLTLSDGHQLPAGRRSCNICAVNFDTTGGGGRPSSFIYGCKRCSGFYAHQRCCRLPRTMHNTALHQHALTLLPPLAPQPRANGHGSRGGGRRCLNAAGKCNNAKRLENDAMSYQCNQCDVEVCLACQLPPVPEPDHGGPAVEPKNSCGNVVESLSAVGQQLATATGIVLRALCCAWLGAPMAAPTPAPSKS
ncbi:protein VACUOLELESS GAMETOPHYTES-like [Miscanthus floridulus]|uniref:protein VACUOLELESS GAMETOPHYTES-like n=1 Tax=Miscanthus floridulus TaxID=154761 RepID=UPI00345B1EDC